MKDEKLKTDADDIELRPDGWDRFRKAVHAAAKAGPKPRKKVKSSDEAKPEKRGRPRDSSSRA